MSDIGGITAITLCDNQIDTYANCELEFKNKSKVYIPEEFVDYSLNYKNIMADKKCPDHLQLTLNESSQDIDIVQVLYNVCLELTMYDRYNQCDTKYVCIPLRFLIELNSCELVDNDVYIKIPFDMFMNEIPMYCIQYCEITFTLTNAETIVSSCKMISRCTYMDRKERLGLIANSTFDVKTKKGKPIQEIMTNIYGPAYECSQKPIQEIIQQLSLTNIHFSEPVYECSQKLICKRITKGFFMECDNVDYITHIKFDIKNNVFIRFNPFLVKTKCVKISQHLLYVPFNSEYSYLDRNPKSFEGSINFSKLTSNNLEVKFNNPIHRLSIYGLTTNMHVILNGASCLCF